MRPAPRGERGRGGASARGLKPSERFQSVRRQNLQLCPFRFDAALTRGRKAGARRTVQATRKDFQAGGYEIQAGRNEIQVRWNEIQISRNGFQIFFLPRIETFQGVIVESSRKGLRRSHTRTKIASGPGAGPRTSLPDGAGRYPRFADFDRIHGNHDSADFDFSKANVRTTFCNQDPRAAVRAAFPPRLGGTRATGNP